MRDVAAESPSAAYLASASPRNRASRFTQRESADAVLLQSSASQLRETEQGATVSSSILISPEEDGSIALREMSHEEASGTPRAGAGESCQQWKCLFV